MVIDEIYTVDTLREGSTNTDPNDVRNKRAVFDCEPESLQYGPVVSNSWQITEKRRLGRRFFAMFGLILIKHLRTRRQQSPRKPRNARRGSGFVQPELSGWASRKYLALPAKSRLTHGTAPVDLAPTIGICPLKLKSAQSTSAERSNPSKKLVPE